MKYRVVYDPQGNPTVQSTPNASALQSVAESASPHAYHDTRAEAVQHWLTYWKRVQEQATRNVVGGEALLRRSA